MSRILTSLHGHLLGLDSSGRLVCPAGFVAGNHGSQIALPGPGVVSFFDDFLGDVIADQWNLVEGTDSATSDAAILAGGIGGVLRITTGDAGTGLAADMPQLTQALQWQASNGGLVFECRISMSQITEAYCFVGFTDLVTLEAPIISAGSADTFTTNATDAVGFMFDTRMTTDNWWLTGVANDVDATHQNSGYAPVVNTYEVLRIEVSAAGVATFYRNGIQVGTAMTGALTAATDLTPTIAFGKLSTTTSITANLDYVHVAMAR
jgi:hypothetical protein